MLQAFLFIDDMRLWLILMNKRMGSRWCVEMCVTILYHHLLTFYPKYTYNGGSKLEIFRELFSLHFGWVDTTAESTTTLGIIEKCILSNIRFCDFRYRLCWQFHFLKRRMGWLTLLLYVGVKIKKLDTKILSIHPYYWLRFSCSSTISMAYFGFPTKLNFTFDFNLRIWEQEQSIQQKNNRRHKYFAIFFFCKFDLGYNLFLVTKYVIIWPLSLFLSPINRLSQKWSNG